MEDDDVGGEKSHDEIKIDENVIGEEDTLIIEERVSDSSTAEVIDITDVLEPSVTTFDKDSKGKTAEPSIISVEHVDFNSCSGVAGDVSVLCAEDMMTENVEGPSTEGLGMDANIPLVEDVEPATVETTENVTPSVIDTGADTIGQDGDDILNVDVEDVILDKACQKK
ncbi:hypothetical protein LIER_07155 [Lithospermum erythrorhizon]|uniref:Uncharacterized protein n=1 Tax=Lithospermum erythrorhizon TaxID=34254 RepID=A0AAV3P7Z9_LITER